MGKIRAKIVENYVETVEKTCGKRMQRCMFLHG